MKGIILAGGTGSRLAPLTRVVNKHLLPVGKYPMIYHSIYKMRQAGIRNILIISSCKHLGDIVKLLGSGYRFGLSLTYRVQDQPGGIAQALGLAEDFVNGQLMTVILADNIFSEDISSHVIKFKQQRNGARVLLKEVEDPKRYGIAEIAGERIVSIEEKPSHPKSHFAVTGIYMYDSCVFDIIRSIKPSGRGELEITDVNNAYIQQRRMTYDFLLGWWTDSGTHESLLRANQWAEELDFGDFGV